jgi:hypothetical protein
MQKEVQKHHSSCSLGNSTKIPTLKEHGPLEQLYDLVLDGHGKPDRVAIDLYTDLRNWYKLTQKKVIMIPQG